MTEQQNALDELVAQEAAAAENPEIKGEAPAPLVQQVQGTLVGYHFGSISVFPGKNNVKDVQFADGGEPGRVIIRVILTGTNRKNPIYNVPVGLIITELQETPLIIAKASDLPSIAR